MITQDKKSIAKLAAANAAVDFVQSGMLVGLGTGSTAALFIDSLAKKCRDGLSIKAVATSKRSYEQAQALEIPLIDINSVAVIDIDIDGADEIDMQKRMIKGGGGALLREKIIANMAKEMIVLVDESKAVDFLGAFPLPIEIIPFAYPATLYHINSLGYRGKLRMDNDALYKTDNGNYIYDIPLGYPCKNPEEIHIEIRSIPGVVETGFFLGLAKRVIIGNENGTVKII